MSKAVKPIVKAVAVAAAVAAVVWTGGAALGLGFATAGSASFIAFNTYVATAALVGGASALVGSLLAGKAPSLPEQIRGQLISQRSPNAATSIVYGKTRLGGTQIFIETSGSNNETMHIVSAIAGHEVNAFTRIFINDEVYNGSSYKGSTTALTFDYLYGTDGQTASSFLAGTSASGYRFRGIACLLIKAIYNDNVFPQGLPNFTAEVEGRKVFDPRTSTTGYSNNAALCIRDYLTDSVYGLGVSANELDDDSFEAAANICDQNVNLAAGGTEKRYTINGAFSSDIAPKDNIARMLTSCAGKLSYAGGKWTLRVGAYRSPTLTITEDMIVGPVQVQATQSKRDTFNAIKGVFSDPTVLYQPVTFPPIENSLYESEDGEKIWRDIELPFTTSSATAQRLAKIELEQSRQQIAVNLSCNLKAFAVQPGDTVNLTLDRYGWTNKIFEVYAWEFAVADKDTGPTPTVNMLLRETASQIYDWSAEETAIDYAPNTNLPDPFNVAPPNIAVTDELEVITEEVLTKLVVTLSGTVTFQDAYEVQAKPVISSNWVNLGRASGNRFELPNVIDGATYDVRARTINSLGVRSAYTTATHQVVGKTEPPQNVQNFSVNIVGTEAHLSWTASPDLDLSHYRVRHSRLTSNATYTDAIDVAPKVSRPATTVTVPAMTGTYFIKAVDKLGLESIAATETVVQVDNIANLNAVETVTEHPAFLGAKNEVIISDNQLVLDTAADFDDISGLFDDKDGEFDGGGGEVSTFGTYDFNSIVDLGAIYTSRVTAVVEVGRIDYVNTFDSQPGLFDAKEGLFDGDTTNVGDVNVELQISTTQDDPAGTPTWTAYRRFFVGDYKAWGLRFRCVLTSQDVNATPTVSALEVTVDMPDRIAAGNDIVSGTDSGGKVVNFAPAFKVAPAIGIAAQNLAQGDYYTITSKSATSFTIKFMDSGGSTVSRTFDYVAKGYGELAA